MLSLFVAASLLVPAPLIPAHTVSPIVKASLPLVLNVPPIPSSAANSSQSDPSQSPRSRRLMPLTATLTLDAQAEEARDEEDLVAAINNERTSRGLGPLALDPLLSEAARAHCREMCDLNYFAHSSPTPGDKTPVDRYLDALHAFGERRPSEALVGENIFYASVTNAVYNADYAHQRLMASPDHRENILEPRFTKVGVGLYRDPQGRFWVTEMFLRDS